MKDLLGRQLEVGDVVVYHFWRRQGSGLSFAYVKQLDPIKLTTFRMPTTRFRYGKTESVAAHEYTFTPRSPEGRYCWTGYNMRKGNPLIFGKSICGRKYKEKPVPYRGKG